jgi:6-phosphogluconate dehydrogenase
MSKIKILMIAGNNSYEAVKELANLLDDPPIMISLGNSIYNEPT